MKTSQLFGVNLAGPMQRRSLNCKQCDLPVIRVPFDNFTEIYCPHCATLKIIVWKKETRKITINLTNVSFSDWLDGSASPWVYGP